MKAFIVKEQRIETVTALGSVLPISTTDPYPVYMGLDVHKKTLAVAVVLLRVHSNTAIGNSARFYALWVQDANP